ncbi:hypothetical protein Pla123a_08420 [Posidoniimonas polymericola]|uniref:DUF885 domain-containing protein n=2 Tax=Posidoniimonas polymericola TaxID=2528002 RepID=A0A5C5YTP2_9BACT|nr:hypothetical protein Pla123a_08420 [Posidoniimonas polymericola]
MGRHVLLLLVWFTLLVAVVPAASAASDASARLQTLLDDAWQFSMQEYPEFATHAGDHRYNDRLTEVSLADANRRAAAQAEFLKRAEAIAADQLEPVERINLALFKRELSDEAQEHRFHTHLTPVSNRSGFHIEFPELPEKAPLKTVKDYENYSARLRAFGRHTAGNIALMREGVRQGVTMPAVILEGWQESVDPHVVDDPVDSLLYKPFEEFPESFSTADQERLRAAGRDAIAQVVSPAYARFKQFMADEYVPNCRTDIGASALPGGRDFYRHRVRHFTTLDLTPDEVHQRGLAEVARIRGEMQAIVERVEFDGDLPAFFTHLRTDPKYYAKTPKELLAECSFLLKRIDGQLPKLFGKLPRTPYGLREIPDYIAPKTTSAYYQPPAGDGSQAGFFCLNTYNLPSRPLYALESLALHESVPGHHLQIALQQELEGLPEFRKYSGFTAYVEGWALYAERLGKEIGCYEDPYSDFGRLSMEMWRACRLVVDTGMHYKGWTRQQAIDYMVDNSALSEHNIRAEVDRYIGWPGQALGYKIGELKIRDLRAEAEQRLGDRFDVRAFHNAVLETGAVPLDVLEEHVHEWLEEQDDVSTVLRTVK